MPMIEDVGAVIHVLRIIQGLSQGQLAEAAGVRNSSISNYERGKSMPKFETLQKLADGLGLPLSVVEETQRFIRRIRTRGLAASGEVVEGPWGGASQLADGPATYDASRPGSTLQGEVEQVAGDFGRVTARALRLLFEIAATEMGSSKRREPDKDPDDET